MKPHHENLIEALRQCEKWFVEYQESHEAKGKMDKAKRNEARAEFCRDAIKDVDGEQCPYFEPEYFCKLEAGFK